MANTNQFAEDAAEIAARLERQRALGDQLSLLPDETSPEARSKRGKGKVQSQLREWLTAQGRRMPEDVLVAFAGLDKGGDPISQSMADAERLLAWMYDGAEITKGTSPAPTPSMRREAFTLIHSARLRAAEALMPYVAPKVTPDVIAQSNVTQIIMPAPSAAGQAGMRDVTPTARRIGPPPMPHEIQANQQVSGQPIAATESNGRTE